LNKTGDSVDQCGPTTGPWAACGPPYCFQ